MFPIIPIYYSSYEKTDYSSANEYMSSDNEAGALKGKRVKYVIDEFNTVLGLYFSKE